MVIMNKSLFLKYLQSIFSDFNVNLISIDNIDNHIIANIIAGYSFKIDNNEFTEQLSFSLNLKQDYDNSWLFMPNFENMNYPQSTNLSIEGQKLDIKKLRLKTITSIVKTNEQTIMDNLLKFK